MEKKKCILICGGISLLIGLLAGVVIGGKLRYPGDPITPQPACISGHVWKSSSVPGANCGRPNATSGQGGLTVDVESQTPGVFSGSDVTRSSGNTKGYFEVCGISFSGTYVVTVSSAPGTAQCDADGAATASTANIEVGITPGATYTANFGYK